MRALGKIVPAACLVLAIPSGCLASGGSSPGAASPGAGTASAPSRERTASAAFDLASMLTGTFQGTTPGNDLRVVVTSALDPSSATAYSLPVRVTGKYRDEAVRQQGVIRLENQGRAVSLTFVPHFDPTVGLTSVDALRFTQQELEAACNFDVVARGDGFFGQTLGSTMCARAIRGAVGRWSLEVEPGSIRIRNSETGETLRFRRISK